MAKLNRVTVLAPAKLNLALDVVGTLPNGYHDLDMTMQAITLYEKVVLTRSNGLNLTLPGSPVAANDSNTAIKAAIAFFRYTGLLAGVDITVYKNIPVRAGMAGGSADAAAVLVGLNALYGARLSMSELCALGAKVGADVPFALMGGTCRVQGVGDVMKALRPARTAGSRWSCRTTAFPLRKPLRLMTRSAAAVTPTAKRRKPPSAPRTWPGSAPLRATRWKSAAVPRITRPSKRRCAFTGR